IGVTPDYQGTQIGVSDPDSPAGRAGLKTWDQIVAVDGKRVQRWNEIEQALFGGEARPHKLTVLRPEPFPVKFAEIHALTPPEVVWKAYGAGLGGPLEVLRVPALAIAEHAAELFGVLRARVAWPLLHATSRLLDRHAFLGLEPSEFYAFEVQKGSPAESIGLR